jgi:Uma2 family endonuclease
MIQSIPQLLTFDEFIDWHPEDGRIFELIRGVPTEVNPNGSHEKLSGWLSLELGIEIRQEKLPFFIPKTATLKPYRELAGYKPDVVVLDERHMAEEPRWQSQSTVLHGVSVALSIEIASTNWRDAHELKLGELKLGDYELMGVQEYWIVDYLGIAAVRHIGRPKRPTLTVHTLDADGEFQMAQFRDAERVISSSFPSLNLTAAEILGQAH